MDDDTDFNACLNLMNSGVKEMWYAPGIGLIRLKIQQGDGIEADIQLESYVIAEPSKDYLPLAIGNKWSYKVVDIEDEYVQEDVLEVISRENDIFYIAHHEFSYYSGSNEQYDKKVDEEKAG